MTEVQEVAGTFQCNRTLAGESEEQLLFNGHMDTVKTGDPAVRGPSRRWGINRKWQALRQRRLRYEIRPCSDDFRD